LFGIGIIEWRILYALAADPNLSANAICSRIDLDKAAASRSIQVLERLGYLTTATDPSDARRRTIALTPAGLALHDRVLKVALEREEHLLAGFDAEERELLLGLLRRMYANAIAMDQYEYRAEPLTQTRNPRPRRKHAAQAAA
jgi:DNA-binding MarR family transcriptional regulator